ncbi:MAG: HAD hydrolase-like protein [Anaerolineaceae bacterium]|nr:HAD hydrolase-like protein [Anaerolineaceae bacterium]
MTTLKNPNIEIINPDIIRGKIQFAIFDFDGTVSLIREGWQQIMIPMMVEILMQTPNHESQAVVEQVVRTYVANTTGKQTIYQMIRLVEEIQKRGGTPLEPLDYKNRYHDLLMDRIIHRLEGLRNGTLTPEEMTVPGSLNALKTITEAGITCFLASGTDEKYVFDEVDLLGLTHYFKGIYGAQDDYLNFSKRMVIQKIIRENQLSGPELVAFGDGYVEIEDTKAVGGIAIGMATDEAGRSGVDDWKRDRLIASGADVIMADFTPFTDLWPYLMKED